MGAAWLAALALGFVWTTANSVASPTGTGLHKLVLLVGAAKSDNAVCLDGSPGSYYIRPGHGTGTSKWYIHLSGGGWCTSLDDCLARTRTQLGSSTGYAAAREASNGYFSQDPFTNTVMYDWNSVIVNYCDGGSFAGSTTAPTAYNGTLLHFRGKAVLSAVREDLLERGMRDASEVVFSGCSAGGLAAILHLDWWAAALRASSPRLTRVTGLPDSGFFLDLEGPKSYRSGLQWVFENMKAAAGVNQDCIAAHQESGDAWKCMFAQHTLPYVQTSVFLLQSAYDWWQTDNILVSEDLRLVNAFGRDLRNLVNENLLARSNSSAVYVDSCQYHCESWTRSTIHGSTGAEAFQDWYLHGSLLQGMSTGELFPCSACCSGEPAKGFPPENRALAQAGNPRRLRGVPPGLWL